MQTNVVQASTATMQAAAAHLAARTGLTESEDEGAIDEPEYKLAGANFAAAHLPMTDDELELDDSPLREKQARLNASSAAGTKAKVGAGAMAAKTKAKEKQSKQSSKRSK